MAAKVLTEAGAEVVMLEAGVMWDSATDAKMIPRSGALSWSSRSARSTSVCGAWRTASW